MTNYEAPRIPETPREYTERPEHGQAEVTEQSFLADGPQPTEILPQYSSALEAQPTFAAEARHGDGQPDDSAEDSKIVRHVGPRALPGSEWGSGIVDGVTYNEAHHSK